MGRGKFSKVAIIEENPKWKDCIKRENELYERPDEENYFTLIILAVPSNLW